MIKENNTIIESKYSLLGLSSLNSKWVFDVQVNIVSKKFLIFLLFLIIDTVEFTFTSPTFYFIVVLIRKGLSKDYPIVTSYKFKTIHNVSIFGNP